MQKYYLYAISDRCCDKIIWNSIPAGNQTLNSVENNKMNWQLKLNDWNHVTLKITFANKQANARLCW